MAVEVTFNSSLRKNEQYSYSYVLEIYKAIIKFFQTNGYEYHIGLEKPNTPEAHIHMMFRTLDNKGMQPVIKKLKDIIDHISVTMLGATEELDKKVQTTKGYKYCCLHRKVVRSEKDLFAYILKEQNEGTLIDSNFVVDEQENGHIRRNIHTALYDGFQLFSEHEKESFLRRTKNNDWDFFKKFIDEEGYEIHPEDRFKKREGTYLWSLKQLLCLTNYYPTTAEWCGLKSNPVIYVVAIRSKYYEEQKALA